MRRQSLWSVFVVTLLAVRTSQQRLFRHLRTSISYMRVLTHSMGGWPHHQGLSFHLSAPPFCLQSRTLVRCIQIFSDLTATPYRGKETELELDSKQHRVNLRLA